MESIINAIKDLIELGGKVIIFCSGIFAKVLELIDQHLL